MKYHRAYDGTILTDQGEFPVQIGRQTRTKAPFYVATSGDAPEERISWAFDLEGRLLGLRKYHGSSGNDMIQQFTGEINTFQANDPDFDAKNNPDYREKIPIYVTAGYGLASAILDAVKHGNVQSAAPFNGILEDGEIRSLEAISNDRKVMALLRKVRGLDGSVCVNITDISPSGLVCFEIKYE